MPIALLNPRVSSGCKKEENESFAVGHLALGYLSGRLSAKALSTRINVPMCFTLSVLADVDILFEQFIEHRGPTHSLVTAFVVFAPFFVLFRKRAVPYFLAFVQHSFIGDYLTGGRIQLLWPLSTQYYGFSMSIMSSTSVALEWLLFIVSLLVMLRAGDVNGFFKAHDSSLILSIPTFAVLMPTILSFPLSVPVWLIPPHLIYTFMFLVAVILAVLGLARRYS